MRGSPTAWRFAFRTLSRTTLVWALLAIAQTALPNGAEAATVTRDLTITGTVQVTYMTEPQEANNLVVTIERATDGTLSLVFDDRGTGVSVVSGAGTGTTAPCVTEADIHRADCPVDGVDVLVIDLDVLNDQMRIDSSVVGLAPTPGLPRIIVEGGAGNDTLLGGDGPESLCGGPGNDILNGGGGNDRLDFPCVDPQADQTPGADELHGGPGDDQLNGGPAGTPLEADKIFGEDGTDTVDYSQRAAPLAISLDGVADDGEAGEGDNVAPDVENVIGGSGPDVLTGSDAANVLDGRGADDRLSGRGGDDRLEGGAGNDTLAGEDGTDVLIGADGDDNLVGGGGDDRLEGGAGNDTLAGEDGTDVVIGADGDDNLVGGGGDDNLAGGGGTDMLSGGPGGDTLAGGPAGDNIDGGDGNDVLDGAEPGLVGADGNDTLTGGAGADVLQGGPGNDGLDGGVGPDVITGGDGEDTLSYRGRTTAVTVTLDDSPNDGEQLEGDNVKSDVEIVIGGSLDDTLKGNASGNEFHAGPGEDLLVGDGGVDVLDAGAASDLVWARDGVRDIVDCGGGGDLAVVDRNDETRNCRWFDRTGSRNPVLGRSALVRGKVFGFWTPVGKREYDDLSGSLKVPTGSRIDAQAGVRVTVAEAAKGARKDMSVSGGPFTIGLSRRATIYRFAKRPQGCSRRSAARAAAKTRAPRIVIRTKKRKPPRRSRQQVVVRGAHSTASSPGTAWTTEERCSGTFTRVLSGVVHVRDLGRKKNVVVRAGRTYLARAK